jgi:hypothetical protein
VTVALAVTIGAHAERFAAEARRRAQEWGLPYLERPEKGGMDALLERDAEALFVLNAHGWSLHDAHGSLAFGPGMARVRLKRMAAGQGEDDVLLRAGELKPGDVVVDATLGLAGDALVCARAVGPTGRVVGIEASWPLWLLVSEGLARLELFPGSCRIEVLHGRARDVLAGMATGSADVVTLDPMFDRPKRSAPTFELLRRYALHEPIDAETLAEARRVARRWVVLKSGRDGRELRRLGLEALPRRSGSPTVWARIGPR